MGGNIRRPSGLALLVGAMLILLPVLAVLQYRWLGQLSDAERDRLQRSLATTTTGVVRQINLELARVIVGLQLDVSTVRDRQWSRYADRYASWRAASLDPAIVDEVLLIEPGASESAPLRVSRWSPAARRFEPAVWPPGLDSVRTRLEDEYREFVRHPEPIFVAPADMLTADGSTLVIPLAQVTPLPPGGVATGLLPAYGYTIVRLDVGMLERRLIPEVIARHFGASGTGEYALAVLTRGPERRTIYEAAPGDAGRLRAGADIDEPFFGLGPEQMPLLRRAASSMRTQQAETSHVDPRRNIFLSVRRGPGNAEHAPPDEAARWRLLVRHRAGSLEAAVTRARQRNLALSFGILVLMGASVALIVIAARRAQQLARQQIEFVAGVSHELRTPVSVINAAADNLAQGVVQDPGRIRQYGSTIRTEARRLGETVERVLQYAGLHAGRLAAMRPVDATAIVEQVLEATAPFTSETGIAVERRFATDVPDVRGDPAALRSAIENLVSNAVKYGGSAGWMRVSLTAVTTRRGRELAIRVEDRGPGIPAAELPHIFEPFYRGADALARQIHGNGLGLSLVKRIVEAHGGRVSVTSTSAGSAFTIHLPAAAFEAARADDAIEPSAARRPAAS